MNAILFTGFPGFLGSALLPRVLAREAEVEAVCLVQPHHAALARARAAEIGRAQPALANRIRIVEGNITRPELGLTGAGDLVRRVVEIYHLAALYDLSVPRDVALRVNVHGTQHVLAFAERCNRLRRLHYVSTCYVSGRFPGVFTETMLAEGQRFNNFYEETKQLAEVDVQRAMRGGLPTTIYRPAVVVGDSRTGETQKFDGPYFVMQWLLRQPRVAVMPVVGDSRAYQFNVVPCDFVVDAIAALSGRRESAGRVYALADPAPLSVDALLDVLARATERRVLRIPLPLGLARMMIDHVPGVHRLLRIPSSAVDYFVHPTRYATTQADADLAPSGITCPSFSSYAPRLVRFMREHPDTSAAAMT